MAKTTKKDHIKVRINHIIIAVIVVVVLLALTAVLLVRNNQFRQLSLLQSKVQELVHLEQTNGVEAITEADLFQPVNKTRQQITDFDIFAANNSLNQLKTTITRDSEEIEQAIEQKHAEEAAQAELAKQRAAAAAAAQAAHNNPAHVAAVQVPILMYHKPPADFDAQMAALKNKGYNTIHMKDLADYFAGRAQLPSKPAVVTFDDGFAVQQDALPILQKYNTKVTLYLIVGGEQSHYCIGLKRIDGEQCGDAYLHPDNVKQMLQSGLVEVGSHTIDHPNLATMSPSDQMFQIFTAKSYLENTFGNPVTTFAYPYGTYNSTSVQLVGQAGYATAVTTQPGLMQNPKEPYLLYRVRETYNLP